jgi:HD-like signal output (HDOD) protein
MQEVPQSLLRKVESCKTLPSIPTVVIEVLDLCRSESVGPPALAQVVTRDPALATKFLKVANSAYYSYLGEVTTLERAISVIGLNGSIGLALGFSLARSAPASSVGGFDHVAYWRRSAIAATASRTIGMYVLPGQPSTELFLAGLVHDIGMLVLNEAIPETYQPIVFRSDANHARLIQNERNELGADHGTMGAWLLSHWKIPKALTLAVLWSHAPEKVGAESPAKDLVHVVALAAAVAEIWCSLSPGEAMASARDMAARLLCLSAETFDELVESTAEQIPEAISNLDLELEDPEEIQRLLDEARDALVALNLRAARQAGQKRP